MYNSNVTAQTGNFSSVQSTTAEHSVLKTREIKGQAESISIVLDYNGTLQIQCGYGEKVEVSQSGISDEDFLRIFRSKVRLLIPKNDPEYEKAVGQMAVR